MRKHPAVTLFLLFASGFAAASNQSQANIPRFPILNFEENRGQTVAQVKYLARSDEGVLFFTVGGLTVSVPGHGAFRMSFEAPTFSTKVVGEQRSGALSNYLSEIQGKSIIAIENYEAIRYISMYPGVDVRFYGKGQHLEHDFLLAPGADLRRITLRLEGVTDLQLDSSGSLHFKLGNLSLEETAPVAWQVTGGKRIAVRVGWKLLGANRLGLTAGIYDKRRALTIDPALVYSTHLGGAQELNPETGGIGPAASGIVGVALDAQGNIFVAGSTTAIDFPTTAGAFDRNPNFIGPSGHSDHAHSQSGFVSKFDPAGKNLLYSTFLETGIISFSVDAKGRVYALLHAECGNFTCSAALIDKLSVDGSSLLYSFIFGPTASSCAEPSASVIPTGIASDNSDHVWIAGTTVNHCLPTTPGSFQPSSPNQAQSGFVAKLDTTQSGAASIVYSTYLGGSTGDFLEALRVDGSGNAYVAGVTLSSDFPHSTVFGTDTSSVSFITKLNSTGSALVFSTLVRGVGANSVALDSSTNVYMSGWSNSSDFPFTAGAFRTKPTGSCEVNSVQGLCPDAFVTELNSAGNAIIYSTLVGGSDWDLGGGITVSNTGVAFITGVAESVTMSGDFPTTPDAFKKTAEKFSSAFVTAINPGGQSLLYSTLLGGSLATWGQGITLDSAGNPLIVGFTGDWNFPITPGAFQTVIKGHEDGFLAKIDMSAVPNADVNAPTVSITSPTGGSTVSGTISITANASDDVGVMGAMAQISDAFRTLQSAEVTTPPYSFSLDTTSITNGQHTLTVMARDAAGNVGSQSIQVTVNDKSDFSISTGSINSATVKAGEVARLTLFVTATQGNPAPISFACSGLPQLASCGFGPNPLNLNQLADVDTTIATTAPSTAHAATAENSTPALPKDKNWKLSLAGTALTAVVVFVTVPLRRRQRAKYWFLAVVLATFGLLAGCGGGNSVTTLASGPAPSTAQTIPGTPSGTYNITISATDGTVTRTLNFQLTVN